MGLRNGVTIVAALREEQVANRKRCNGGIVSEAKTQGNAWDMLTETRQ